MNDDLNKLKDEKGTVLVEFFATWCPHCQRMMPVVDDLKALFEGQVSIYQFDFDKYSKLDDEFGVESVPTFILFKDGEEVWRGSGEMPGNELASRIQNSELV